MPRPSSSFAHVGQYIRTPTPALFAFLPAPSRDPLRRRLHVKGGRRPSPAVLLSPAARRALPPGLSPPPTSVPATPSEASQRPLAPFSHCSCPPPRPSPAHTHPSRPFLFGLHLAPAPCALCRTPPPLARCTCFPTPAPNNAPLLFCPLHRRRPRFHPRPLAPLPADRPEDLYRHAGGRATRPCTYTLARRGSRALEDGQDGGRVGDRGAGRRSPFRPSPGDGDAAVRRPAEGFEWWHARRAGLADARVRAWAACGRPGRKRWRGDAGARRPRLAASPRPSAVRARARPVDRTRAQAQADQSIFVSPPSPCDPGGPCAPKGWLLPCAAGPAPAPADDGSEEGALAEAIGDGRSRPLRSGKASSS